MMNTTRVPLSCSGLKRVRASSGLVATIRISISVVALAGLFASLAPANSLWLGTVDDDWFNTANWDNGVPQVTMQRAQIESATDLANWPVIKGGETITLNERLLMPQGPPFPGQTFYGRLTIEAGATFNLNSDLRAGDEDGLFDAPMVGSLDVAGALNVADRARFGDNDYMTIDVNVSGSLMQTVSTEDFRIGGGEEGSTTFDVFATGLVSVGGEFELREGGLLSLADDATFTLMEYEFDVEDELGMVIGQETFTKADSIALMTEYVTAGQFQGLTNTYSGSETLSSLGNGVAYFENDTSVTFVAADDAAMLTGDFNGDGTVNAADYTVWRDGLGGLYTSEDYDDWVDNFGATLGTGAATAAIANVPESSTTSLLVCLLSLLSLYRESGRIQQSESERRSEPSRRRSGGYRTVLWLRTTNTWA